MKKLFGTECALLALLLACSSDQNVGEGSTEETNAIADGILWNASKGGQWRSLTENVVLDTCEGLCGSVALSSCDSVDVSYGSVILDLAHQDSVVDISEMDGLCVSYSSELRMAVELDLGESMNATVEDLLPAAFLGQARDGEDVRCVKWAEFDQDDIAVSGREAAKRVSAVRLTFFGEEGSSGSFNVKELSKYNSEHSDFAARLSECDEIEKSCSSENNGERIAVFCSDKTYPHPSSWHEYYGCNEDAWKRIDEVAFHCDTTGAQVGDLCNFTTQIGWPIWSLTPHALIFTENREWVDVDVLYGTTNIWCEEDLATGIPYGGQYAVCRYGKWRPVEEAEFIALETAKFPADTADGTVLMSEGSKVQYIFKDGKWRLFKKDDMGTCSSENEGSFEYVEKDEFICLAGKWQKLPEMESSPCDSAFFWNGGREFREENRNNIKTGCKDPRMTNTGVTVFNERGAVEFEGDPYLPGSVYANNALNFKVESGSHGEIFFWTTGASASDVTPWKGLCLAYTSNVPLNVELNPNPEVVGNDLKIYSTQVPAVTERTVINLEWSDFSPENVDLRWNEYVSFFKMKEGIDVGIERLLESVNTIHIAVDSAPITGNVLIEQIGSLGQCK